MWSKTSTLCIQITKISFSKITKRIHFCAPPFYRGRPIYLPSFLLILVVVFELCPGQSSDKVLKRTKGSNSKISKAELSFLNFYSMRFIYTSTQLLVETFCSFDLCIRQDDGRTYGWTEKESTIILFLRRE